MLAGPITFLTLSARAVTRKQVKVHVRANGHFVRSWIHNAVTRNEPPAQGKAPFKLDEQWQCHRWFELWFRIRSVDTVETSFRYLIDGTGRIGSVHDRLEFCILCQFLPTVAAMAISLPGRETLRAQRSSRDCWEFQTTAILGLVASPRIATV